MKRIKLIILTLLLFTLETPKLSFAQDSLSHKVHFGFHGNLNFNYQRFRRYYPDGRTTEYRFTYAPSLDFFLRSNRFYLDLGLLNFGYRKEKADQSSYGPYGQAPDQTITSKEFQIEAKLQFNFLLMNPEKYFMVPLVGLGISDLRGTIKTHYYFQTNPTHHYSSKSGINAFGSFVNVGLQKNVKKNMFIRLDVLNNFYTKIFEKDITTSGHKISHNSDGEWKFKFTYVQIGFGASFN